MIPWTDGVRQSGKLSIYLGSLAGEWGHVFRAALHDFNVLSAAHKLGVAIAESKHAPDGESGANVSVQSADGAISATYGGESRSKDFDGNRLHGLTMLFSRQPENQVEKAFIYLPSKPRVNTPRGLRPAGAGVMKVIATHELLHACGLENSDHSTGDIFQGTPRVDAGDSAPGDKVLIGTGPKKMPPVYLGGDTAKRIKELWTK